MRFIPCVFRCLCLTTCSFPFGTSQQGNTVVLLHDAFQPLRYVRFQEFTITVLIITISYWQGFQTAPGWQGVAMDTHIYQMFSQDVGSPTASCITQSSPCTISGGIKDESAAHRRRLCRGVFSVLLRPLDYCWRVDARSYGLRQVSERTRCWRAL